MIEELEEINPEYLAESFTPPQDYRVVGRPKLGGVRYYLVKRRVKNDDEFHLLPGVTSVLKQIHGVDPELAKWMATYPGGYQAAKDYGELRADYGSTMHAMVSEVTRQGIKDDKMFEDIFLMLLGSYGRGNYLYEWLNQAKSNLASWLQWVQDYDVIPIFSELPLVSFKHKWAGQLDYLCTMNAKKYTDATPVEKRKRILAMPDWKFGNSIQYDTYTHQLGIYGSILKHNYPSIKVHGYFNWRPTETIKGGGYQFQQKHPTKDMLLGDIFAWRAKRKEPGSILITTGPYRMGSVPGFERMPALEFFKEQYLKQQEQHEAKRRTEQVVLGDVEADGPDMD